jgi:hypothetical protein
MSSGPKPRSLDEVQLQLAEWLQSPRSLLTEATTPEKIADYVTGNDRLTPAEQVEIYREQYWLRHTSSLLDDFPGLSGIIGQREWERLVEGYLLAHPPKHVSLRDLGARLADYVSAQHWLHPHELCVDMARLEWAYIECFDAGDDGRLEPARLSAIAPAAWASARLVTAQSLRLLHVRYPVAELRKQLKASTPEHELRYPEWAPQHLVIYREQRDIRFLAVSAPAFKLLESLEQGLSLVASAEQLLDEGLLDAATLGQSLQGWFEQWARLGWIVDVVLPEN